MKRNQKDQRELQNNTTGGAVKGNQGRKMWTNDKYEKEKRGKIMTEKDTIAITLDEENIE